MQQHFSMVKDWHGVPGVVYPEAPLPEMPAGWVPMAEAARRIGCSCTAVYKMVRDRGLSLKRCFKAKKTACGAWHGKPFLCVCWRELGTAVPAVPPPGYISGAECCRALGLTQAPVSRLGTAGKLRSVLCFDKSRGKICRFYHAGDVAAYGAAKAAPAGWLTTKEAAARLGVSRSWLSVLLSRGHLRGVLVRSRRTRASWFVEPGSVAAEVLRRRGLRVNADNEYVFGGGQ